MLLRENVAVAAQNKAEQIIEQAKQDADSIRADADSYVLETLTDLEGQLDRILQQARNGITLIRAKRGMAETEQR